MLHPIHIYTVPPPLHLLCLIKVLILKEVISAISKGVRAYALDPHNAEALWKKSEELVGESF